jgi:hypothetical protein
MISPIWHRITREPVVHQLQLDQSVIVRNDFVPESVFLIYNSWFRMKVSSPIADMSCLLEKPGGAVIRYHICFHRTRQTIIQLPRIVWSSGNRCHQEDWDVWLASKQYTHFGVWFVAFAHKYWHPVRVHKGSMLLCNTNEKPNSGFSVQERWNHDSDKTHMEKTLNDMKFIRRQWLLLLIFAGTVHGSQGITLQRAVTHCHMKFW